MPSKNHRFEMHKTVQKPHFFSQKACGECAKPIAKREKTRKKNTSTGLVSVVGGMAEMYNDG